MRRLTMAAAAVVGAIGGGAVLGDDHMSGEHVDCSYVSWHCLDECLELTWCVAIPENDGIADCLSERLALDACEADPGGGVIIIGPPACPAGQHLHASDCHANHVCGGDEIGGGDQDCEACPDGEVPNEDGTACQSCPHGEGTPGQCQDMPCGQTATDSAAELVLVNVPPEPGERATLLYCRKNEVHNTGWSYSTASDECRVSSLPAWPQQASCWTGGSKAIGCNLSITHTHPFFKMPQDYGVKCRGEIITSAYRAFEWNLFGMYFSQGDRDGANKDSVDAHMAVSNRSCMKAYRGGPPTNVDIFSGMCEGPSPPP